MRLPRLSMLGTCLVLATSLASAQQSVTYELAQTNVAGLRNATNYLDVTLTSPVAGTVDVTVTAVYSFVQGANFGIQALLPWFAAAGVDPFGPTRQPDGKTHVITRT